MKEKSKISKLLVTYGIELVLVAMIIIASALEPSFRSFNNFINVIRQVSITGMLAIGMTFIIINGNIDLSVSGIVGFAGMVVVMMQAQGFGLILSILAVIVIGLLIGVLNGYYVSKGLAPFIVTMATDTMIRGLAYIISNGQPVWGVAKGFDVIGQGFVLGFGSFKGIPIPVIIFGVVAVIAHFTLNHTTYGRTVYSVGGNPEASRLSGISIVKSKIFVYCISGFLAALTAVVLTSRLSSCDPTVGVGFQLDAIASTVIGGTSMSGGEGKIYKTVIGILIIGILSNVLNLMAINPYIQQLAKGLIIFLAVVWDNSKRQKAV